MRMEKAFLDTVFQMSGQAELYEEYLILTAQAYPTTLNQQELDEMESIGRHMQSQFNDLLLSIHMLFETARTFPELNIPDDGSDASIQMRRWQLDAKALSLKAMDVLGVKISRLFNSELDLASCPNWRFQEWFLHISAIVQVIELVQSTIHTTFTELSKRPRDTSMFTGFDAVVMNAVTVSNTTCGARRSAAKVHLPDMPPALRRRKPFFRSRPCPPLRL
ncbi:hypothetical protein BC831DRAFT_18971 [Entophlyctis helioformis]|nr:hypothetical protein BC831DRAFT_18971 [Entophlyctis helioformis]